MPTPLHDIGSLALKALGAGSSPSLSVEAADAITYEIDYAGPGGAAALPDEIADYDMVLAQDPQWTGAHRLVIRSPSTVFDVMWNDGEPLRIMSWCRGDWEETLRKALT